LQLPPRLGLFPGIYCKEVLEVFFDHGMSPNQQDVHGNSPLQCIILRLMEALKNLDMSDRWVATAGKLQDMIRLLCERGANPYALNNNGKTPLQMVGDAVEHCEYSSPAGHDRLVDSYRVLGAAGDAYQILHQNVEQEAVDELRERRDALLRELNEMQRMLDEIPQPPPSLKDALRAVQLRVQIEDMQEDDIRHINAALASRGIE
jgi:hypothetical protein